MTSESVFPIKDKKRHKNLREFSMPDPQVRPPVLAQHPKAGCRFAPPVRGWRSRCTAPPRRRRRRRGCTAGRRRPRTAPSPAGTASPAGGRSVAARSIFSRLPGRFAQAPGGGSASRLRIGLCKAPLPQPIPSGDASVPQYRALRRGRLGPARPARELGRGQDGRGGSLLACLRHLQNENPSLHVETGRTAFLPPKLKIVKNPFWASIKRDHERAASFACRRPACASPR